MDKRKTDSSTMCGGRHRGINIPTKKDCWATVKEDGQKRRVSKHTLRASFNHKLFVVMENIGNETYDDFNGLLKSSYRISIFPIIELSPSFRLKNNIKNDDQVLVLEVSIISVGCHTETFRRSKVF
jgi:hypothetical protein